MHFTTQLLSQFMTWWFTVSKVKEVKGKIVQCNSLAQLFEKFSPEQLQVPQFILDYDYGVCFSCLFDRCFRNYFTFVLSSVVNRTICLMRDYILRLTR